MLIYIAGPYSARGGRHDPSPDTVAEIDNNIRYAMEAAKRLARAGIPFFCPHLNSYHFEVETPEVTPEFWYRADMEILRRCDALLVVNPNWRTSKGTNLEISFARSVGMPVFWSEETGMTPSIDKLISLAYTYKRYGRANEAKEQERSDAQTEGFSY